MTLAREAGVTVGTTAGGGLEALYRFLRMLPCSAGVKVAPDLGAYATLPGTLRRSEEARRNAEEADLRVLPYVTGKSPGESDTYLESCLAIMTGNVTQGSR